MKTTTRKNDFMVVIAAPANAPAGLADTCSGPTVSLGAGNVNIALRTSTV